MLYDLTHDLAVAKAEHLKALGVTTIYLRSDEGFPWSKTTAVETGSSYRMGGPSSCYIIAEEVGLQFKLSVDFEGPEANGRSVALFDRDRLREVARKLPALARAQFAAMLSDKVLPGLAERTRELRQALTAQADSEDVVRGLIAYAAEPVEA